MTPQRLKLRVIECLVVPLDPSGIDEVELDKEQFNVRGDTLYVTRLWKVPVLKESILPGIKLLRRG